MRINCTRFWQWAAWHLPRALIYCAGLRLWTHATSGPWSHERYDVTLETALRRWREAR